MPKAFQKKIEDFTCEHCGAAVRGNGYTNHCPHCLHSKDVDVRPGDRASKCGGLMIPIRVEAKDDAYVITHRCQTCGKTRRNRSAENDDFDAILSLAENAPPP